MTKEQYVVCILNQGMYLHSVSPIHLWTLDRRYAHVFTSIRDTYPAIAPHGRRFGKKCGIETLDGDYVDTIFDDFDDLDDFPAPYLLPGEEQ